MRRIHINGCRKLPVTEVPESIDIAEVDDGGVVWAHCRTSPNSRAWTGVELSAEGLAELANAITAWFMDDPREIVAQARKAVADLKEMLTDYNAEADRMGGEFMPFDRMHDRAEAIEHRLGELAKVFSATRRSA